MKALASAGIYVISDLSSPGESINRDTPAWNDDLYARYTSVVDSLANYTNVIGFFAGNEVSNAPNNTNAAPFVKAAVRDTKAYIKSKNYRAMGVGYATDDDATIRDTIAEFFDCGDSASAVDFWGYNIYSWCGDSSYTKSGYNDRTTFFEKYNVPAFFAEYGCNTVEPRTFGEVATLYGSDMSPVWSGGIVYMYFQEANNYGERGSRNVQYPRVKLTAIRSGVCQRRKRLSKPGLHQPCKRDCQHLSKQRGHERVQPNELCGGLPDRRWNQLGREGDSPPTRTKPAALQLHVRVAQLRCCPRNRHPEVQRSLRHRLRSG